LKREPGVWGYKWVIFSLGDINTENWSSEFEIRGSLCKRNIVAKSKEAKTGCNLVESSKKGYGSNMGYLPMMTISAIYLWLSIKFIYSVMTICMSGYRRKKCILDIREN
jgi:hypothetical protein